MGTVLKKTEGRQDPSFVGERGVLAIMVTLLLFATGSAIALATYVGIEGAAALLGPALILFFAIVKGWPRRGRVELGDDGIRIGKRLLLFSDIQKMGRGADEQVLHVIGFKQSFTLTSDSSETLQAVENACESWRQRPRQSKRLDERKRNESERNWEARLRANLGNGYRKTPAAHLVRIATDPKTPPEERVVAARIAHDLVPHSREDLLTASERSAHPEVRRALKG